MLYFIVFQAPWSHLCVRISGRCVVGFTDVWILADDCCLATYWEWRHQRHWPWHRQRRPLTLMEATRHVQRHVTLATLWHQTTQNYWAIRKVTPITSRQMVARCRLKANQVSGVVAMAMHLSMVYARFFVDYIYDKLNVDGKSRLKLWCWNILPCSESVFSLFAISVNSLTKLCQLYLIFRIKYYLKCLLTFRLCLANF